MNNIQDFIRLFRGKAKETHEWVTGSLFKYKAYGKDCMAIIVQTNQDNEGLSTKFYEIEADSLGMYTGVDDCEGKHMFTGDVICSVDLNLDDDVNEGAGVILSNVAQGYNGLSVRVALYGYDDSFYFEDDCYFVNEFQDWKVIGNSYDSPNLCEEILKSRVEMYKKYQHEKRVKELLERVPEEKVENTDGSWWERYIIQGFGVQWVYAQAGWTVEEEGFIADIEIEFGTDVKNCVVHGENWKKWSMTEDIGTVMKAVEAKYKELYG